MKAKAILFIVLAFFVKSSFSQNYNPAITKYVTFLETQHTSAKDYVLNLFKKYDMVVLCERNHGETTQYDLIYDIVSSPYFEKNVGNIFTEIGSVSQRGNVQNFIHTKFDNEEDKTQRQLDVYRNIQYGTWEKTNFYNFIGKLNTLNSTLDKNRQINLFVSGVRYPNKEETSSVENFKRYLDYDRDSIIAQNVIATFDSLQSNSPRKKALVIMNYRHAFSIVLPDEYHTVNVGAYLIKKYSNKFANVLINGSILLPEVAKDEQNKPKAFQDMVETVAQQGKWDAAFKAAEKENLGFDFKNSPFGKDHFDKWDFAKHNYTYEDVFTGFVFYLPIEKHMDSFGVKDLTKGHEEEIYEENSLEYKALGAEPPPMQDIKDDSQVETEKSYDDLDTMLQLREQWLKK